MAPTLVLAAHGTRSEVGTRTVLELADAVSAACSTPVQVGWVDVRAPRLADLLATLGEAVVVPVFLTRGYHVTSDIPAAIAAAGGRATATPLIGGAVLPAVADRLSAVGEADAVVLAGAGSLRPGAVAEVVTAAGRLADILGRPVRAGFVTASSPSVPDAVQQLRDQGQRRIAIAPYLLAPGRFSESLSAAGADLVADPIGVHPLLVDLIVRRWRDARETPDLSWQPGVAR